MDEHFTRESHGSYGSRAPMDYDTGGGAGAGLLFAVIVLGAIVLGTFFIGSGGAPAPEAIPAPADVGAPPAAPAN